MRLENNLITSLDGASEEVKGVWVGLYWSAVESRFMGMSHTYKTGQKVNIEKAGILSECPVSDLCERIFSWEPLEASIGLAAINSLIEPQGIPGNVKSYIKREARGKNVSIIGRFPFIEEVRKVARKTYQLEMNPNPQELPPWACEEVIPRSEINVISATALINHTLERLLELGENGTNIVLGPSTPLSPVLFEYGADILAGVRIHQGEKLTKCITQGVKKFRSLDGTEPLCLHNKR